MTQLPHKLLSNCIYIYIIFIFHTHTCVYFYGYVYIYIYTNRQVCVCVCDMYTYMFTSFYMDFSPRLGALGADQLDLYQADTCINDLTVKHIPW